MIAEPAWDVAVVGGGPSGLSAARAAAAAGARTIVLERAEHPRYKTCGGGLIGTSLAYASEHIDVPARDKISALTFTRAGRHSFTRRAASSPFLTLVRRDDFDHAWYSAAVTAGAVVRQNAQVRAVDQGVVTLTDGEQITAGTIIGADGSAGITSRYVGVTFAQQDLGLEVELAATEADRSTWEGRVLLDWGSFPGSYGWVFPKQDELTVGVIMAKGHGAETKKYLAGFLEHLGLSDRRVVRDSGHLTRCRRPDAPLRRGRVAVVGDAAGLLEPWTREGISYALRSGGWAGSAWKDLSRYEHQVTAELAPEMAAGRRMLDAFSRYPRVVHAAMATPLGWRAFESFCQGNLSMAGVIQRPSVRALLTLFRA
ncbi:geranylgeranyl reductase family protein [Paractinoplanes hotanensis]|uniref:Geranylgeranyl reductase family protein n=1 Tax=Paractinoplanes hotanensis TaxID=2906497 RepID=A0ABT0Y033_9ACTN|nr:geranylgeranyl reductase family protein [Actinoplanes hotanensis]MCM4079402.1 geranylgeranyl reductase family protein [Actinoplanes hotanensis]